MGKGLGNIMKECEIGRDVELLVIHFHGRSSSAMSIRGEEVRDLGLLPVVRRSARSLDRVGNAKGGRERKSRHASGQVFTNLTKSVVLIRAGQDRTNISVCSPVIGSEPSLFRAGGSRLP